MIWKKALSNLREWMVDQYTHPELTQYIIQALTAWQQDQPIEVAMPTDDFYEASKRQQRLGWDSAIEGRMALGWQEAQHRYYLRCGLKKTGRRWLLSLIKKCGILHGICGSTAMMLSTT